MPHRAAEGIEADAAVGAKADVYVHAAALYVAMLKNGYFDEATEFAEWFLETFDYDLED